jgi:hypothetical protein
MAQPAITVRPVDIMAEAYWRWETGTPQWRDKRGGPASAFDPFPAYRHDVATVEATAQQVAAVALPAWDVDIIVADREEVGRTNGFSAIGDGGHYEGDEWVKDPPWGLIMLSGKRIPPHPAMTRYLVAHEIGHHVEWWVNWARGAKNWQDATLVNEYAELRGLGTRHFGTGGRWHDSPTEVFACDFRIVVCGIETEFWPHLGVPRPEEVGADLKGWWAQAIDDLRASVVAATAA